MESGINQQQVKNPFGPASHRLAAVPAERRNADRFPIQRELTYRVSGRTKALHEGKATTVNISSNGVLFESQDLMLAPGRRLELSISWPAQLDGKCLLRLAARAHVVRAADGQVAVQIDHYEFRTAGRAG